VGNAKKLDLKYDELVNIAIALNQNILANKTRSKEERISTDHFIRQQFDISRKDFSFTCKDYGITYNPTTFLYEIPNHNAKVMSSNVIASPKELIAASTEHCKSNAKQNILPKPIENTNNIEALLLQLIDMVKGNSNKVEPIRAELSSSIMNLTSNNTKDDVKSHCNKVYEPVYIEFKRVCDSYQEFLNQDLFSLALLEFIKKYKKV
jgi:hypothetical protein